MCAAFGGWSGLKGQEGNAHKENRSPGAEQQTARNDSARIFLLLLNGVKTNNQRISYWDSVIADAHRCHEYCLEGKATNFKGNAFSRMGLEKQALKYMLMGYQLVHKYGVKTDVLAPLYDISTSYYRQGDIQNALNYSFKGLRLVEEIHDKRGINLFSQTAGLCYFFIGDIQKAIRMQLNCLASSRELKDSVAIASALADLGSSYHALNQDTVASGYYLECKSYLRAFGSDHIYLSEAYNAISAGYSFIQHYDSAYRYALMSYSLALKSQNKGSAANSLVSLSSLSMKIGNDKAARYYAEESQRLTNSCGFVLQNLELAKNLKTIYLKSKDYKKAMEAFEVYTSINDSLTSATNRKQALEKEFNYNLEKKENAYQLLAQQNRIQRLENTQNKYLFIGLAALLLLLLLALVIAYLVLRQNKLKGEQQSDRLGQKLLRTQMNPHFIFNSLQAIQHFVLKEDKQKAGTYLGAFADVMRNVLENSRMESIPLQKEISLLKDYLELQQLRFHDRFDYEISLGAGLEPELISVPPMLAQPFIENAIEHGFHDIKSGGRILVSYTLNNNTLMMEITDNGSGLQDDPVQSGKHQSLAIEITKERVALMNKKLHEKVSFNISEAFPMHNHRKGVKVSFVLPLSQI